MLAESRNSTRTLVSGSDTNAPPAISSMIAPDALTFQPHQHDLFPQFCQDVNALEDWHSLEEFLSHPEMFALVNQYFNRMCAHAPRARFSIAPGSMTMGNCFHLFLLSHSLPEYLDEGTLESRIAYVLLRSERELAAEVSEDGFSLASIPGFPTSESADGGLATEENGALWPYAKRLEVLRGFYDKYIAALHLGDIRGARNAWISTLKRPLYQTEGIRITVLLTWIGTVIAAFSDISQRTYYVPCFDEEAQDFVRAISSNEEETFAMRATAMLFRAISFRVFHDSSHAVVPCHSVESNYTRRAILYSASAGDTEWPPVADVPSMNGSGNLRQFDARKFFDAILDKTIGRLRESNSVGSLASQVDDVIDFGQIPKTLGTEYHLIPHSHTLGGLFCDGCGKESDNFASLFKCKQCRLAFYCNSDCQAKAWEAGHRHHCKCYRRFQQGDMAILQNLQKASHLNHHWVRVEGKAASPGRLAVHLLRDGNETGKVMAVKKKNLRHHRPLK